MGSQAAQEEQNSNYTTTVRTVGEEGWPEVRQDGWRWGIVTLGGAGESGHRLQCPAGLLRSLSFEPRPPLR